MMKWIALILIVIGMGYTTSDGLTQAEILRKHIDTLNAQLTYYRQKPVLIYGDMECTGWLEDTWAQCVATDVELVELPEVDGGLWVGLVGLGCLALLGGKGPRILL